MRQRINLKAVATSNNYHVFKKVKREYLTREHKKNQDEILKIVASIHIKMPYTIVFGKLIPLTIEEANTKTLKIIWQ